ncbi:hypothetical protein SDC9_157866 [bioreactor metagenome]|uniref:Uncharacterized protein n=1 Tax=bioreactor metagenome TaxID=1076179 RepID=A0A645F8E0_9ZZZZ
MNQPAKPQHQIAHAKSNQRHAESQRRPRRQFPVGSLEKRLAQSPFKAGDHFADTHDKVRNKNRITKKPVQHKAQ